MSISDLQVLQLGCKTPGTVLARELLGLRAENEALEAQRDALLGACKEALQYFGDTYGLLCRRQKNGNVVPESIEPMRDILADAIAKAEARL